MCKSNNDICISSLEKLNSVIAEAGRGPRNKPGPHNSESGFGTPTKTAQFYSSPFHFLVIVPVPVQAQLQTDEHCHRPRQHMLTRPRVYNMHTPKPAPTTSLSRCSGTSKKLQPM